MNRTWFIVGLEDVELKATEKKLLGELRPAGVILFKRNLDHTKNWFKWYKKLVTSICEAIKSNELILSIDHEGGKVMRLGWPFTQFSSPREYKDFCDEVGAQMGQELKHVGFNLSFSPCVDVDSNPNNPVIGSRSFSRDPHEVSRCANKFLNALQSGGVFGCFKHYPGHGDTEQDSHFELPVVRKTLDQLYECELVPYLSFPAELRFIMTAHVLYPEIDTVPATLSKFFLQDLLRQKLGFRGHIIADDIEMKALVDFHKDQIEFLFYLKEAGVDFVIYSANEKIFHDTLQ
ncbi:MAG: beta-N-acetylhexosaminidase, partial [Deltaproteobacteria bacterium]|nr:beta-N-acetylhexosaminidase [Deltaproteobacteria bacterium]